MEDIFAKSKRKWTDEQIDRADDLASRMMASKDWDGDWSKAFAISRWMENRGYDVKKKPSKPHKEYIPKKKKKRSDVDWTDYLYKESDAMEDNEIILEAAKKNKKWIPKNLKEGRFTEYCKRNGYDGPCEACAHKALKSDDESVRGMASFYLNVAKKKKKKAEVIESVLKLANSLDGCGMDKYAFVLDNIVEKIKNCCED